ncbi:MAG: recombination protein O N-terminal domain-containing protein [Patescibacteria group bacterium]|nr:recombination protein O N-terminal domain-containing protein [Patescibacteria group bacterium]MCX7589592.1 recombination protein O N-terminal domain-containing protein [Patescibacteria group bacterium]MDW8279850.1 recombination protein O N-terminal domain-containing protein [bacterium]
MQEEYISEAIVLMIDSNGDLDKVVSVFTKNFGKIIAKVKSASKITSKLRGHLEPGNLIIARLIFKNKFQLVDVLKQEKLNLNFYDLYLLNKILPEMEQDENLYFKLKNSIFSWFDVLKILGWDPKEANCINCGSKKIFVFDIVSQNFFCQNCLNLNIVKNNKNDLIYL